MRSAAAARDASSAAAPAEPEWAWSVDVAGYDRRPGLRPLELAASAALVKELVRRLPWPNRVPTVLERLVQPVEDALARAGGVGRLRTAVLRVMAREMHRRSRVFWGWTHEEWVETLGETERDCLRRHHGMPEKRQHLIAVAYLLGEFTDWSAVGEINKLGLARKIFGPERVDATVGRVLDAARGLGYGSKVQDRLQVALCEALLANHSPRLQDLNPERFEVLRRRRSPSDQRGWFVLGQALFGLGLWPRAPRPALRAPEGQRADEPEGIASEWIVWCERWRSTSTLPPTSRVRYHRLLVLTGRWLAQTHPEVRGPEQWMRELAAAYVAALARATVGQWGRRITWTGRCLASHSPPAPRRATSRRCGSSSAISRNGPGSRVASTRGVTWRRRALCGP
jgi:hypothetical protein